jgi:hypothetical protein
VHFDARAPADVLVIGALIRILESAPAADVVDEDDPEVGTPAFDILNDLLKRVPPINPKPALPRVGIGPHNGHATAVSVFGDDLVLIVGGVLLVLGGHANVLRGGDRRGDAFAA